MQSWWQPGTCERSHFGVAFEHPGSIMHQNSETVFFCRVAHHSGRVTPKNAVGWSSKHWPSTGRAVHKIGQRLAHWPGSQAQHERLTNPSRTHTGYGCVCTRPLGVSRPRRRVRDKYVEESKVLHGSGEHGPPARTLIAKKAGHKNVQAHRYLCAGCRKRTQLAPGSRLYCHHSRSALQCEATVSGSSCTP